MITIVKLGGRVQSDPALIATLRDRWSSEPGSLCLVHGGGDEISGLQRELGREPSFVNGRRITTHEDMDLVRMVLSGSANKRLVGALVAAGVPAVGVSGEDGGLIGAEQIDESRFGRTGRPTSVDPTLIETLLAALFLPVISPVARDAKSVYGEALNVNGDDAAAALAGALEGELLLVADVEGVMDGRKNRIPTLDPTQVEGLVADGTVNQGMCAKIDAGFAALSAGAKSVRIGSVESLSDHDAGTFLSLTPSMT
ncbi:MAG TPA: acetylglutamate kinase [Gemmatimonadaceae bacterium]|nr:acetylglutamate kinase [Gemmatimonadaceae bacterium]